MNTFSISQLEQFSGIKAHTIRIWEQRYQALSPDRTEGNTRFYDDSQLRRLLNIVSLMDSGLKVSKLCSMSDPELFGMLEQRIADKATNDDQANTFISQLIAAGMSFDEAYFDRIFAGGLMRYGMKDTYAKVIYPMLVRIGLMWKGNALSPASEHFISNLIRQKLFAAIDSLPSPNVDSDSWLLFLPENEFHELGLLIAHYFLRQYGRKVFYLGNNVPEITLAEGIRAIKPDNLLLFMVHNDHPASSEEYLVSLKRTAKRSRVFVAGNGELLGQIKKIKDVRWVASVDDLLKNLA